MGRARAIGLAMTGDKLPAEEAQRIGLIWQVVDDAARAKFLATIPLGRFSTALDVANAALFLASEEAAFISGVCLEVDGARCV